MYFLLLLEPDIVNRMKPLFLHVSMIKKKKAFLEETCLSRQDCLNFQRKLQPTLPMVELHGITPIFFPCLPSGLTGEGAEADLSVCNIEWSLNPVGLGRGFVILLAWLH